MGIFFGTDHSVRERACGGMGCFAKEIFCVPAGPRTPTESVLNTEPAAKRLKRYLLNGVLK